MNCLVNVRKEPIFKPLIKPKQFQDKRREPKHIPNKKKETPKKNQDQIVHATPCLQYQLFIPANS